MDHGYCHCGCGNKTNVSKKTSTRRGLIKGQPVRFLPHHHIKFSNPNFKGGIIDSGKCWMVRANDGKYYPLHRVIAEMVRRKPLPKNAAVHHVNEDCFDNTRSNLVVCEDNAYHFLLHKRRRAYMACGNAKWLKCKFCKEYDDPSNLFTPNPGAAYHRKCGAEYARKRRALKSGRK